MNRLVGGILRWNDRILLGKRSEHRADCPGVWDLIGGHCCADESFTQALVRELFEEIGVVPVEYERLIRVDNQPTFIYEIYLVRSWTNPVTNRCPDEHSALAWFTPEQARQLPLADERYVQLFDSILTQ